MRFKLDPVSAAVARLHSKLDGMTQRVHVGIWYVLRAQRGIHIPTLRPKYIPYTYMDPLGERGCLDYTSECLLQAASARVSYISWVLPLSNSWITILLWLYTALSRTPNIDCYWVGAVPNIYL